MGILDEAIRDHLELKRRGGTQAQDLMRLEDEAFGPPTRPGDAEPGSEAGSEAAQALKTEDEGPAAERASTAESAAAPESAPAQAGAPAANRTDGMSGPAPEGGGVFYDFAAEEGLVPPSAGAAAVEQEFNVEEAPAEPATGSDAVQERAPEPPAPPEPEPEASEQASATPTPQPSPDDTQPHDMEAELGPVEAEPQGEPAAAEEVDDDLELHVEEDEIEIVEEEIEIVEEEGTDESPEEVSADDVLEETPDFLQDTPEHDRLWFEQKPPKDFDFDE
jgi:hypothetical protein